MRVSNFKQELLLNTKSKVSIIEFVLNSIIDSENINFNNILELDDFTLGYTPIINNVLEILYSEFTTNNLSKKFVIIENLPIPLKSRVNISKNIFDQLNTKFNRVGFQYINSNNNDLNKEVLLYKILQFLLSYYIISAKGLHRLYELNSLMEADKYENPQVFDFFTFILKLIEDIEIPSYEIKYMIARLITIQELFISYNIRVEIADPYQILLALNLISIPPQPYINLNINTLVKKYFYNFTVINTILSPFTEPTRFILDRNTSTNSIEKATVAFGLSKFSNGSSLDSFLNRMKLSIPIYFGETLYSSIEWFGLPIPGLFNLALVNKSEDYLYNLHFMQDFFENKKASAMPNIYLSSTQDYLIEVIRSYIFNLDLVEAKNKQRKQIEEEYAKKLPLLSDDTKKVLLSITNTNHPKSIFIQNKDTQASIEKDKPVKYNMGNKVVAIGSTLDETFLCNTIVIPSPGTINLPNLIVTISNIIKENIVTLPMFLGIKGITPGFIIPKNPKTINFILKYYGVKENDLSKSVHTLHQGLRSPDNEYLSLLFQDERVNIIEFNKTGRVSNDNICSFVIEYEMIEDIDLREFINKTPVTTNISSADMGYWVPFNIALKLNLPSMFFPDPRAWDMDGSSRVSYKYVGNFLNMFKEEEN